jgi:cell division protein FtsQ
MTVSKRRRKVLLFTVTGIVAALAAVAGGVYLKETIQVRTVAVSGTEHTDSDAIRKLAAIDSATVLFDIDPAEVAERVGANPWVEHATVRRVPTGTLSIRIQERVPVALALDADGAPAFLLDRNAYPMPLVDHRVYDLPLVRGVPLIFSASRPIPHEGLRHLLAALAGIPDAVEVLVSEIVLDADGNVVVVTPPGPDLRIVRVHLGREGDFADRLHRMHAFWHAAVLTQPEKTFQSIDLRFDGQIVTRERP